MRRFKKSTERRHPTSMAVPVEWNGGATPAYSPVSAPQPRNAYGGGPLYPAPYAPAQAPAYSTPAYPPPTGHHGAPAHAHPPLQPQLQRFAVPNDPRAHLARPPHSYGAGEAENPNFTAPAEPSALSPRKMAKAKRKADKAARRQRSTGLRPFLVGTLFGMGLMFVLLAVPITDVLPIGGVERLGSGDHAELRFETPRDMSPPAENTFLDQAMEGSDALPVSDATP